MSFFKVVAKPPKNVNAPYTIDVDFVVPPGPDLMVRGGDFYGVWDSENGIWSRDINVVQRIVDDALFKEAEKYPGAIVKSMSGFSSGAWMTFRNYLKNVSTNVHTLDSTLLFADHDIKRADYATKKLPYSLQDGDISAWEALVSTLYNEDERRKIEWAIGSVVSGKSRHIQKFFVFYGSSGTGKSTILNIIEDLFRGYTTTFDAKALGISSRQFATSAFSEDPLVAIQHDGDLSKIEDNTRLNSIISHELMLVDEKFKKPYQTRFNAALFIGTNSPVKITDSKSGLIRRLIDISPTGDKIESSKYHDLMSKVKFEHGAIAKHCLNIFESLGEHYYDSYRPNTMMYLSNKVYQFVMDEYDFLIENDPIQIKTLYTRYLEYCNEGGVRDSQRLSRSDFKSEIASYYEEFKDRYYLEDGTRLRNVLTGFNDEKTRTVEIPSETITLKDADTSIFDQTFSDYPAQLATKSGTPRKKWDNVTTKLSDLDPKALHYVKVPENLIVVDFDISNNGVKDLEVNLKEASLFPPTYTEVSKSGGGVHLHYFYDGDLTKLSNVYKNGVEVKVYKGGSALRRQLTQCNDLPIATISQGSLPIKKEENRMLDDKKVKSEKALRDLIQRNLRKEIHPGTKPSVDFISTILEEAYESGLEYDVSDLKPKILLFAQKSTNHGLYCLKVADNLKYKSKSDAVPESISDSDESPIVFFDVEVYKNLFVICWMYDTDMEPVAMINPSPDDVDKLTKFRLIGFNNRRYDNHILYGRLMGYSNEELYNLSQAIINGERNAMFGAAYSLSYTDILDFSSKKQSLKKFEVELGINHLESWLDWDKPVEEAQIPYVVSYCKNDVRATRAVFHAREADFKAREILAKVSGLSVNESTNTHTAKILFGNNSKNAYKEFEYTDLSDLFPGYKFDKGVSSYRGENPSEGGYVYAEPGMYENVAVLDVASMHPTSIEQLNLFGPYTSNFSELKAARIAIKHGDFSTAKRMLDGRLTPFLDEKIAPDLAYALKIVINTVYGMTSAHFENPFRDPRNVDNIVAKRGALFMIDLKLAVQEKGYTVAHIKTDSIKIPNADEEIIKFVMDFGRDYGYEFEHETTYDKMCLVNDAVYIARKGDKWEAVGAQFQHPYVFKTLFSKEEVTFEDLCEVRQVTKGVIHIEYPDGRDVFVGRLGKFTPSRSGGNLVRELEGKRYAVTGTKGWTWEEASTFESNGVGYVDMSYAEHLAEKAKGTIEKFGSYEAFVE